jgi:hypothetical protein
MIKFDWDHAQNRIADASGAVTELQDSMTDHPTKSHSAWSMLIAAEVHLKNAQDAVAAARRRFALDVLGQDQSQDDATDAAYVADLNR